MVFKQIAEDLEGESQAVDPAGVDQPHSKVAGHLQVFGLLGENVGPKRNHLLPIDHTCQRGESATVDLGLQLIEERVIVHIDAAWLIGADRGLAQR
jgi:hypothetical protein